MNYYTPEEGLFVTPKPISLQGLEKYSFYANVSIAQDLISLSSTRPLKPMQEAAKLKALELFGDAVPQEIGNMSVTERIQLAAIILITACDRAMEKSK